MFWMVFNIVFYKTHVAMNSSFPSTSVTEDVFQDLNGLNAEQMRNWLGGCDVARNSYKFEAIIIIRDDLLDGKFSGWKSKAKICF